MDSVSVTNRINAGFGLLTLMVIAMAAMAFLTLRELGGSYQSFRAKSEETLVVNNVVEDLFEARIGALKYRLSGDQAAEAEVTGNIGEILRDTAPEMAQGALAPMRETFAGINAMARAYQDAFEDYSAMAAEVRALEDRIRAAKTTAEAALERLTDIAATTRNFDLLLLKTRTERDLLLGKIEAKDFARTGALSTYDAALGFLDGARQGLAEIGALISTQSGEAWAGDARADHETATAAIAGLVADLATLKDLQAGLAGISAAGMDRIGPQLQDTLEETLDAIIASQQSLGASGQQVVDRDLVLTPLLAGLAVVLAIAAAFGVGRWINRPLRRLTDTTETLSQGDTDVAITGTEHDHELGRMARALEVFRDSMKRDQAASEAAARTRAEQELVVTHLSDGLGALAAGHLDQRITQEFPAEYERLRTDFNSTLDQLEGTIGGVITAARNVDAGVAEINAASEDLSRRTENQAATLEQSAAALDELTSSINQAATRTREVEKTMQTARAGAQGSAGVVQEAVQAMGRIGESSQQISKITDVISDIAFQTNLLALNAGVEAARAGEAGRGFAVVASEVRALAQRSSEAVQEVSALIATSSAEVDEGTRLVNRAGQALQDIIAGVDQVTQLISDITASTGEQAAGISEINTGVAMLDEVTQKNAGMVETSFNQGQKLVAEVKRLEELIRRFKVSVQAGPGRAPMARAS